MDKTRLFFNMPGYIEDEIFTKEKLGIVLSDKISLDKSAYPANVYPISFCIHYVRYLSWMSAKLKKYRFTCPFTYKLSGFSP